MFSCTWCDFQEKSYYAFSQHVGRNHKSKISRHQLKGDAESHAKVLKLTKCKICKAPIPHDSFCILEHLREKHKYHDGSLRQGIERYVSLKDKRSQKADLVQMQKCFVSIKFSKFVQHFKDSINQPKVQCVQRKEFTRKRLGDVCYHGSNIPVKPTTEIGDLCLFECKYCKKEIRKFDQLLSHLSIKCRRPYLLNRNDAIVMSLCIKEARYHLCRMCNKVTLCDLKFIKKHLWKYHRIYLNNYLFKKPDHINWLRSKLVVISDYKFKGVILSNYERDQVPMESITTEVEDLCAFQCDKCHRRCYSFQVLRMHLTECKGTTKFHKKYMTNSIIHECKICGVRMLCDKRVIGIHIRKHEKTLIVYTNLSASSINKQINSVAITQSKTLISSDSMSKFSKSSVPLISPLKKVVNPPSSLASSLTTNIVENLCSFACGICEFKTNKWGGMKSHNRHSDHGPGNGKYNTKYVKEARYHKCVVCNAVMLCDIYVIKSHVTNSHGYPLEKYVQICKEKGTKAKLPRKIVKSESQKTLWVQSKNKEKAKSDTFSYEFANLVIYKCDKCDETFHGWSFLLKHLKKCQNKTHFDKKYIFQKVMHECKICKKKVLCDKRFIMSHIRGTHKMYAQQSYIDLGKEDRIQRFTFKKIKCDDGHDSYCMRVKMFASNLSTGHLDFTIPRDLINDSDMTSELGNFCMFQCVYCKQKSDSWSDMMGHVNKEHRKDDILLSKFHRDYLTGAVYHKCYICQEGVLCDETLINHHTRKAHGIFFKEKYKEFKNSGHWPIPEALTIEKTYEQLPSHMSEENISNKPTNACTFSCDKCPQLKTDWQSFRIHKNKMHKEFRFPFEAKYVKRAKYYQCPICQTYILCDRVFFRNHLNRHKIRRISKFEAWLDEKEQIVLP